MNEDGMADQQIPHLTGIVCENLLTGSSGTFSPEEEVRWRNHLRGCQQCTEFMERYRAASERLLGLPGVGESGNDCPRPARWAEFAAGLMDDDASGTFLDHVIDCDACGALLRIVVGPGRDVETPSISMNPGFVQETARKAAREAHPRNWGSRFFSGIWKPVLVLAAVATVAVVSIWTVRLWKPAAETLVARAYEQNRTWPIRMPGAAFTPAQADRRGEIRPTTALSEAEAAVSRRLDEAPKDARFIDLQSRLDVVRHRYSEAITPLEALVESGDTSRDVLLDLGSAHLARGLADRNASDLDSAVDQFGRVLSREPSNPVALFNRAAALEEMLLIDRAEQAWSQYLAVDSTSPWAQEARDHLRRLQEKKKSGAGASNN
ncbi:MAG TPA: hypothetical protein VGL72_22260 [Bryobacteraceae bacterium]